MQNSQSSQALPWHRSLLYGLTNWALWFAGLANLAVGTWSALNENAATAATSLSAGLVLFLAATVDRFDFVKGWGFEAKTRQLDQKINQADEALRYIREITELTGATLIDIRSKLGRFDSSTSPREAIELASKVRTIMTSLSSDSETISAAMKPWALVMCRDLAAVLLAPIFAHVHEAVRELEQKRQSLPKPWNSDDSELLKLNADIVRGHAYLKKRHDFPALGLSEYPDRFLSFFDDVPLVAPEVVASQRQKAESFASDMKSLRDRQELPRQELWISTLSGDFEG